MVYSRAYLETLKMSELRKIGEPIGARDTSKSELIDEILVKQPRTKELSDTQQLISELSQTEGNFVETYELRERILERLKKLKKLELKERN